MRIGNSEAVPYEAYGAEIVVDKDEWKRLTLVEKVLVKMRLMSLIRSTYRLCIT